MRTFVWTVLTLTAFCFVGAARPTPILGGITGTGLVIPATMDRDTSMATQAGTHRWSSTVRPTSCVRRL